MDRRSGTLRDCATKTLHVPADGLNGKALSHRLACRRAHAFIIQASRTMNHLRLGSSAFALVVVSFIVGLFLARFNVVAAGTASLVYAAASLLYGLSDGSTFMYALLVSVATACTVQVGYLVGQLVWPPRR